MRVTVVIPSRNEEDYIEKCITSVLTNNYPKELLSVNVCDGNSTDNTLIILEKLNSKYKNLNILINQKQTTPFALNMGIKATDADIYIIFGAHAKMDKNYIQNCVDTFKVDSKIGCVGGIIENTYENDTAEIVGLAMSSTFGVGNALFRTGAKNGYVDTVAFGAYKKEVFDQLGYFDENLTRNQDDEFNYRVTSNGFKIYLNNAIKSNYYVRSSYRKLISQYFQYGYWKVVVNTKFKTITSVRQVVPAFFVLFLMFSATISWINPLSQALAIVGISTYILLAIYAALRKTKEIKKVLLLVYTFFLLHLSYGSGYLKAVIEVLSFRKFQLNNHESLSR